MDAPANILRFETRVDGKRVQTALEQKALVDGIDHSAWLTANRVPLAPHLSQTDEALARLTQRQRAEAIKLGLIDDNGPPAWILRSTFQAANVPPPANP